MLIVLLELVSTQVSIDEALTFHGLAHVLTGFALTRSKFEIALQLFRTICTSSTSLHRRAVEQSRTAVL